MTHVEGRISGRSDELFDERLNVVQDDKQSKDANLKQNTPV